ncbi:MAG: OmpP1/FadL family transporter [Planctomycetota bacterium]
MSVRSRALAAGALCVLAARAPAQQGGEFLGIDPAAAGRAGVDLAIAEGPLSIGTNPAGLAFLPTRALDVAARLFFSQVDYRNGGAHEESVDRLDLAPLLGIAWPSAFGPVAAGVAFFPEQGYRGKIRLRTEAQAGPGATPPSERIPLETSSYTFAASPALAVRVSDSLAFGLAGIVETTSLEVDGFTEQPVGLFAGEVFPGITFGDFLSSSGFTVFQSDYRLDARGGPSFALRVGALWKPAPGWSVGATYRSPSTRADLHGDITVDMSNQFGDPGFDRFFPDGRTGHYDVDVKGYRLPQSAGAGIAWEPSAGWRLGADVRWVDWSAAFDELRFELDDGDNAGFNTVIGDDGFEIDFPLRWRDLWAGAIGVERRLEDGWTLRGGFAANTNPVPDRTASVYAPAFSRYHAAVGASKRLGGAEFHAAYLHSFREEVRVGQSGVASDFDGSRVSVSVDSLVLGISVTF